MKRAEKGQALTILIIFVVIAIIITTAATMTLLSNISLTTQTEKGQLAYDIAESGAENAILRLLRNPDYTGETLLVGSGSATIQVSGSAPITIVSKGTYLDHTRTIQVTATYTNNILTITSWREVL